jgi:hypothetical protein
MYKIFVLGLTGLLSIILSNSALGESDRTLLKLQMQQSTLNSELKILQNQVRSLKPTKRELESLQAFIQASICLKDQPKLEDDLNRDEFAIILHKCFQGVEIVAISSDPNRLIRNNIVTIRKLRDEFNLELAKLNSIYTSLTYIQAKLNRRILSFPLWDSNIPDDDMHSLRSLIYKYFIPVSTYISSGFTCDEEHLKDLNCPIGRLEYGVALNSLLNKLNEIISNDYTVKFDRKDLQIIQQLQEDYWLEMSLYRNQNIINPAPADFKGYINNPNFKEE